MKRSLSALILATVLAVVLACGCATKEALHPITTFVVPNYSTMAIRNIGLMPIAERPGVQQANAKLLPVLETQLATKTEYVFLSQEQVLGAVQKSGISEKYNRLVSAWQKEGMIPSQDAAEVAKTAGVDALLFVEVTVWSREWVPSNVEGESVSKAGLKAVLVGGKSGEKLWESFDEQTLASAHYAPQTGVGTYVDQAGMVRSSSTAGVPEPPAIEEVATRVAAAVFRVFP